MSFRPSFYSKNIVNINKLSGNALKCTQCGDDNICKPGVDEKQVDCKEGVQNCFISLMKHEGKLVDVKGCLDQGGPGPHMRGCIHISGEDGVRFQKCNPIPLA